MNETQPHVAASDPEIDEVVQEGAMPLFEDSASSSLIFNMLSSAFA